PKTIALIVIKWLLTIILSPHLHIYLLTCAFFGRWKGIARIFTGVWLMSPQGLFFITKVKLISCPLLMEIIHIFCRVFMGSPIPQVDFRLIKVSEYLELIYIPTSFQNYLRFQRLNLRARWLIWKRYWDLTAASSKTKCFLHLITRHVLRFFLTICRRNCRFDPTNRPFLRLLNILFSKED